MLRVILISVLLAGSFISFPFSASSQAEPDTTAKWLVETNNGDIYLGNIVSEDSINLVMNTEIRGGITIAKADIKSRKMIASQKKVKTEKESFNPIMTRYFFGASAIPLKKGEGCYQNSQIFFSQVNYGLHENFSAGIGATPLYLLSGVSTPFWITAKFSIPVHSDFVHVAGGGIAITAMDGENREWLGSVYAVATIGTSDQNFSFGTAYGFFEDNFFEIPLFTLSGVFRAGKRIYVITENYIISYHGYEFILASFGAKWAAKSYSIDFGGFFPVSETRFFAFPWLGLTVPFGKR